MDSRCSAYLIDLYVDGDYVGTVTRYGDLYLDISHGAHRLYGESPDQRHQWGPRSMSMGSSYAWTLSCD